MDRSHLIGYELGDEFGSDVRWDIEAGDKPQVNPIEAGYKPQKTYVYFILFLH